MECHLAVKFLHQVSSISIRQFLKNLAAQALELRVWVTGFDMAGHEISKAYNDNDAPLGKFQLEQQLPEYSFEQPQLSPSKGIVVGDAVDLAVIIKNTGKSDGFAELRVERVESNGARTIIHAQEVKVQSGGSGYFTHRWTPDREGSMWIEFIVIGGPTAQTKPSMWGMILEMGSLVVWQK